jgi:Spy/CpxP family protein refolding chaperone
MRLRTVLIPAGIAVLAAGIAAAGPGHEGRRHGRTGMRLERMAEQLDLTEGQRTRMREIFQQHRDGPLGDAIKKSRDSRFELRGLIHDPAADESAIRAAASRAADADADVAVERHKALREAWSVLTPEQQEKAKALREQREQRRRPSI